MNFLHKLNRDAERWALLVFYVMLVATMAVEVLRREIFAYSSIWGEEIVRYSFIYLAWIGAAAAVRERAHIRIDVIMHYVGPRMKAALYILGDLVMAAVAVVALYWSWETVLVSAKFGSVSAGLRVSMVWWSATRRSVCAACGGCSSGRSCSGFSCVQFFGPRWARNRLRSWCRSSPV